MDKSRNRGEKKESTKKKENEGSLLRDRKRKEKKPDQEGVANHGFSPQREGGNDNPF